MSDSPKYIEDSDLLYDDKDFHHEDICKNDYESCFKDYKPCFGEYTPCHDKPECCTDPNCIPTKNNCKPECCNGLPKVVPDLRKTKSVPILVNRIFDCMRLESPNFAISTQTFTITSTPPNGATYTAGDKVCIDKICIKYDAIAAVLTADSELTGTSLSACSQDVIPVALPGSIIDGGANGLSNEFAFTITNNSCCYDKHFVKEGKKCRIIEQGIPFNITGLKIVVSGKAGCLPFSAEYTVDDALVSAALDLPATFNFFGKLCVPQSNSGVLVRETFEPCLTIDCIDTTTSEIIGAAAPYTFTADIESSLLLIKHVFSIVEEKLSVLTMHTPREQRCHDASLDIDCPTCSHDNK